MTLANFLSSHRSEIIDEWFNLLAGTYPEETTKFLKRVKDPFTNPVGAASSKAIRELFEAFVEDKAATTEDLKNILDGIIRIRAVQDFKPSQATAFIFLLKDAVRTVLKRKNADKAVWEGLTDFESEIDSLALVAFDVYMACREQLFDLKTKAMHRDAEMARRQAGDLSERRRKRSSDNNE